MAITTRNRGEEISAEMAVDAFEDDDVSMTSSLFFSFPDFELMLQIKSNKSIKICKIQNSHFKHFGTFSKKFRSLKNSNNA